MKTTLDMCCFGLKGADKNESGFIKKATSIITNSEVIANHLSRRCDGSHKHYQLKGGSRFFKAAIYCDGFCKAIIDGYNKHRKKYSKISGQRGSLGARDFLDSQANSLDIGRDDPEDGGEVSELIDTLSLVVDARLPQS